MKWLKHMSATRRDERIASLIDEHGFEGYGVFWAVLETIAEQMPAGEDRYEVGYSLKRWGQLLGCHHNKVKKYLSLLGVHGLVTVKSEADCIIVSAPNLLKYRDEYSKKSGRGKESGRRVSSLEGEGDREGEREADTETKDLPVIGQVRNGQGSQPAHCTFPVMGNRRHHECGAMPAPDSTLCALHRDLMANINAHEVVSS